ncbi:hypothetical protein D3C78_1784650 [compost metagenome]
MQYVIAFTEQQDFGAWCHIVAPDRFRVVGDVAFRFIGKKGEVLFPGLRLGKTSTHRDLQQLS